MVSKMVESKYTQVRVNNEIELCEVYERTVKDRIEKAFVKSDVSFFIKWKRERNSAGNGKYIICVNQHQKQRAEAAIHGILEDVNSDVTFVDRTGAGEWKIKRLFRDFHTNYRAILSKM